MVWQLHHERDGMLIALDWTNDPLLWWGLAIVVVSIVTGLVVAIIIGYLTRD